MTSPPPRSVANPAAATDLADELEDRFGELPDAVRRLLAQSSLRAWCATNRIASLNAGPQAVALTPADPADAETLATQFKGGRAKEGRVLIPLAIPDATERLHHLCQTLGIAG